MKQKNSDGWFFNRSIISELQDSTDKKLEQTKVNSFQKKKRESTTSLEKQLEEKRKECLLLERRIKKRRMKE